MFPTEGGNLVIKSNDTWDQGRLGVGKGCNYSAGG